MSSKVLFGGGALAVEAATYIADCNGGRSDDQLKVAAVVDAGVAREEDLTKILGYKPLFVRKAEDVFALDAEWLICVGDPVVRSRVFWELQRHGCGFATLVHPSAYVAATAVIGAGTILAPFVFVGPFAQVHDNALLNVRATIGHDAVVGHSAVLSPHVDMNGHSSCGEASFLGAGTILQPGAALGRFSKAASGAVLKSVVGDGFLVHGNPASGRQMFRVPDRT